MRKGPKDLQFKQVPYEIVKHMRLMCIEDDITMTECFIQIMSEALDIEVSEEEPKEEEQREEVEEEVEEEPKARKPRSKKKTTRRRRTRSGGEG